MPTHVYFAEPVQEFFSLLIVDTDGDPLDSFDVTEPVNVAIIHITDGPEGFSRTVFSALKFGLSVTVAEIDFGWGVVVCHLPQVYDDIPGDDVQRVLFSAQDEFFRIIFGDPDADGPTGEKAAYGPPDGVQGPAEIDPGPGPGPDDLLGWQSLDNASMS